MGWMQFFFPALQSKKRVRLLWIWEQERELSRSCLKPKQMGNTLQVLRFRKSVQIWPERSVRYNHLEDDVEIVRGDIKEAADIFGAASFDVVTSNPPYMIGQHGLRNPDMPKAIARHEVLCNLEDVVSQASKVLKERGRFYMVHRPFRLAEIMNVLTKYRLDRKGCSLYIHT